jgi:hypothetical protein
MTIVSTCPVFLTALQDRLSSRGGLASVAIYTAGLRDENLPPEAMVFAVDAFSAVYEYPVGTPMTECFEEYIVEGRVQVLASGSGEEVIRASRERAFELLDEVAQEFAANDTMTGTVDDVRLQGWKLTQDAADVGRYASLSFTVRVRAHFTPA